MTIGKFLTYKEQLETQHPTAALSLVEKLRGCCDNGDESSRRRLASINDLLKDQREKPLQLLMGMVTVNTHETVKTTKAEQRCRKQDPTHDNQSYTKDRATVEVQS